MAREAEAATWAQKRHHMYAPAPARKLDAAAAGGGPWVVPTTIGFPRPALCRALHVWGHPPSAGGVDAPPTMLPVWPRHLAPPRPWAPPPAYWQHQYNVRAYHIYLAASVALHCITGFCWLPAGGQEVGSTSSGSSSDARHGAAAAEVPGAAAPGHHVQTHLQQQYGRPAAAADEHQARRLAASARRAPGM